MIARMDKNGVITLEPQSGAESVALRAWAATNRVEASDDFTTPTPEPFWRFDGLVVKVD